MGHEQTPEGEAPRRRLGEVGAVLIEYALIVAFVVAVCLVAVTFYGESVSTNVDDSSSQVSNAGR